MLSNKSWGKQEERKDVSSYSGCFPSHCNARWSPALLGMAEHLRMGSSELIPYFALLAHTAFAVKQSLSHPTSFLTFAHPILSPLPLGRREQVAAWGWAVAGVSPQVYLTCFGKTSLHFQCSWAHVWASPIPTHTRTPACRISEKSSWQLGSSKLKPDSRAVPGRCGRWHSRYDILGLKLYFWS